MKKKNVQKITMLIRSESEQGPSLSSTFHKIFVTSVSWSFIEEIQINFFNKFP